MTRQDIAYLPVKSVCLRIHLRKKLITQARVQDGFLTIFDTSDTSKYKIWLCDAKSVTENDFSSMVKGTVSVFDNCLFVGYSLELTEGLLPLKKDCIWSRSGQVICSLPFFCVCSVMLIFALPYLRTRLRILHRQVIE